MRKGLTLIEVLAVIAIVVILVGITTPVLVSSKQKALESVELSQLRQLGQARSIYAPESEIAVTSVSQLVEAHLVPETICFSPLDRTNRGMANSLVQSLSRDSSIYTDLQLPYPTTYVGFRELNYPADWLTKHVSQGRDGGWLVSMTASNHGPFKNWSGMYFGRYHRLLLDGSVQAKEHAFLIMPDGAKAQHPIFWFADTDEQWKREFTSGSHL
jgi:prepilin-type N-terminal cleavage/methylation domain-containing protein